MLNEALGADHQEELNRIIKQISKEVSKYDREYQIIQYNKDKKLASLELNTTSRSISPKQNKKRMLRT